MPDYSFSGLHFRKSRYAQCSSAQAFFQLVKAMGLGEECIESLRLSTVFFFFSSRRRHTRFDCDWSSDVCSSDLLTRRRLISNLISNRVERIAMRNQIADESAAGQGRLKIAALVTVACAAAVFGEIGRASCRERV